MNTIAGAMEIQEIFENSEWAQQPGSTAAFAPHLRDRPFDGVPKKVLIQVAKGDITAPNPIAVDVIRAGNLADVTTFYRHDVAFGLNGTLPKDPHNFVLATLGPTVGGAVNARSIALAAQEQIADFVATDGEISAPAGAVGALFETPIVPPLPESALSFIP